MINNFFTLRCLAQEWEEYLTGWIIEDIYSQVRGELSVTFRQGQHRTLQFLTGAPLTGVFQRLGKSKARRNTARLLGAAWGQTIKSIRIAERDRILTLSLGSGLQLQAYLFGTRANVHLADARGVILETFRNGAAWAKKVLPPPQPAPMVNTMDTFLARWKPARKTTVQAVTTAFPLFDSTLAMETVYRAGVIRAKASLCTDTDLQALCATAQDLRLELADPTPCIYWENEQEGQLSLVPLHHATTARRESFDTVDHAVRIYAQRTLGHRRLQQQRDPLEKALSRSLRDSTRRAARMRAELANECRADRYERWGHLLLANPGSPRAPRITLPDIFADNTPVDITLDPALGVVANAERYYQKARKARQARNHLCHRVTVAETQASQLSSLLERLRTTQTLPQLQTFRQQEAQTLATILPAVHRTESRLFRRFVLPGGYAVWAGRNAKESDTLTLHHTRPYDLWMHARGVAGAHVILRLPGRNDNPARNVVESAASIAAYFSKARGSSLVPVLISPRKYVRKPKGAAPGMVIVEREEVLLVQPTLPTDEQAI